MATDGFQETYKSLDELVKQLDPKMMKRALRNTLAAEARRAPKAAQQELAGADIHNAPEIAKQAVWGALWKRNLDGFAVRAKGIRKTSVKGMYRNSKGKLKPLAMWFDQGTAPRKTSAGFYRGSIQPPLHFMESAEQKVMPDTERRLVETFRKKVEQQIQKYGK